MTVDKNLKNALQHCLGNIYVHTIPHGVYDQLLKGTPQEKYPDYEILRKDFETILEDSMKLYEIKHKIYKNAFRNTVISQLSSKIIIKEKKTNDEKA